MMWNISAECVSTIILCIIWVYSRKGNPLPTLQNKCFHICFLVSFFAILSNILATILLFYYPPAPLALVWAVNLVYFILTPLMTAFYFLYVLVFVVDDMALVRKVLYWAGTLAIIYVLFVLSSPFTGWVFFISPERGYERGPLIAITYLVFYLYCFACPLLLVLKGRHLDKSILRILFSFPIIAAVVIIIQSFAPQYILSGSAATCALLIIYLNLQNKKISIDHLTNLANRQEFMKTLEMKIDYKKEASFGVLVLSLRQFKTVNDKFGQKSGNGFLQEVANYVKVVAGKHQAYRFSGDEFAILISPARQEDMETAYRQLTSRMVLPWRVGPHTATIGYAIGVVVYPRSADNLEGLVDALEFTVQQAKSRRGEPVCYCTPEMYEAMKRRGKILELLKSRLESKSFEVHYQPILSLDTKQFNKAEALLRMTRTPIGPVYPSEFIPIAEETGLIVDITYQVLRSVCMFVRWLLEEERDILSVSVNYSSRQFSQPDVLQRTMEIIDDAGVPYDKIKIEITESVLIDNKDMVVRFIKTLHDKGVRIALDDFGMGYSNISTVLGFPIDTVKLDKSLVWAATESPRSELVVRHIVAAFKGLGMEILAEGVEDEAQRVFVEDCGCDMIQGFLYARPMPEQEVREYMGMELMESPCPQKS